MKKIIIVMVVALLAIALVACGEETPTTTKGTATTTVAPTTTVATPGETTVAPTTNVVPGGTTAAPGEATTAAPTTTTAPVTQAPTPQSALQLFLFQYPCLLILNLCRLYFGFDYLDYLVVMGDIFLLL